MPPASSAEREEERRLNTRTLTIASVASASAAAVTSQLWIAGTWIAAALTPVLVALISEAMHRPTERIARAWTSEREMRRTQRRNADPREPTAVTGSPGPVRVYRQSGPRTTVLTKRRIAIGTVAATAAIAFVIGIVALTTVDLVSGGSVGKGSGRSTLFSGSEEGAAAAGSEPGREAGPSSSGRRSSSRPLRARSRPPPSPLPEQSPSDTAPVPPPSDTPPGEPLPDAHTP